MGDILKKPYELSIWEDQFHIENPNGEVSDNYDRQYYKETKILEIGSSTMSAPNRATNVVLTENVNGSKTLTFSMYYKYIDNESGELVENPWINLLTNERKLKLWYGDDPNNKKPEEWYDFLIKDVNESSEEHLYTYTANNFFINELSKIGYDVVLNTELENSTGTITDLAETILKNTDWEVDFENSDNIKQFNKEALYKLKILDFYTSRPSNWPDRNIINCPVMDADDKKKYGEYISLDLSSKNEILGFYECIKNKIPFFQFIYKEGNYAKDDDRIIINAPNLYFKNVKYSDSYVNCELLSYNQYYFYYEKNEEKYAQVNITEQQYNTNPSNYYIKGLQISFTYTETTGALNDFVITFTCDEISTEFKGNRLVHSQLSTYDKVAEKTVKIYNKYINCANLEYNSEYIYYIYKNEEFTSNTTINKDNYDSLKNELYIVREEDYYGYEESEYITPVIVDNFISDGDSPQDTNSWIVNNNSNIDVGFWPYYGINELYNPKYINKFFAIMRTFETPAKSLLYMNSVLEEQGEIFTSFKEGEELVCRLRITTGKEVDIKETESEITENEEGKPVVVPPLTFKAIKPDIYKDSNTIERFELKENYTNYYKNLSTDNIFDFIQIRQYSINNGEFTFSEDDKILYNFESFNGIDEDGFCYTKATCSENLSEEWVEEMKNGISGEKKIGFFIKFKQEVSNQIFVLENIQLFNYRLDDGYTKVYDVDETNFDTKQNSLFYKEANRYVSAAGTIFSKTTQYYTHNDGDLRKMILPGDIPESSVITWYNYYLHNPNWTTKSQIELDYRNKLPNPEPVEGRYEFKYIPKYTQNYTKSRTVEGSESNCFNLIQDLCETFECWAKFEVEHSQDGRIVLENNYLNCGKITKEYYDSTKTKFIYYRYDEFSKTYNIINEYIENIEYYILGPKKQKKKVKFLNYIGKDNYIGFKYGINLTSIERELESESLVTKMIVKDNTNEFGKDGYCSISRAIENPTKQNFLFNFDYYINQGLLNYNTLHNDLYFNFNGYLGYYQQISNSCEEEANLILEKSNLNTGLTKVEAQVVASKVTWDGAETNANETLNLISLNYLDANNKHYTKETINDPNFSTKDNSLYSLIITYRTQSDIAEQAKIAYEKIKKEYDSCTKRLEEINNELDSIRQKKAFLNEAFFTKYSRFIQEGTWTSDDYTDDTLYYYDAESVLYTSSRPQTTYTINVLELSQVENFELYNFNIGDKTFIEDTEFFGWLEDGITPYKEEVVVSEIAYNLDNPVENTITVQNYKTQFEDLFQRITATVNSIEYHEGEYASAAAVINNDGTINSKTFQDTISQNNFIIGNAKNQSVTWDGDNGIIVRNFLDARELVRIVSGGIFISSDAGQNWSAAITGFGINANYLTAGAIDTSRIYIGSGKFPTFKWDDIGITSYSFNWNEETNEPDSFNYSKFIRFDQFGLYGINGSVVDEWKAYRISDIEENANFGLTWNGFFLKSEESGGQIKISSTKDIQVLSTSYIPTEDIVKLNNKQYYYYSSRFNRYEKFYGDEFAAGITYYEKKNTEKIRIGRIRNNDGINQYGLSIKDNNGKEVMFTNSDGQLYLQQKMIVGPEIYAPSATFGVVPSGVENLSKIIQINTPSSSRNLDKNIEHIIDTEEEFVVFDDGYLYAQNAEITGNITATEGSFTGSIYATSGEFNGEIYATGGTLGALNIVKNGLLIYKNDANNAIFNDNGIKVVADEFEDLFSINIPKLDSSSNYIYRIDNWDSLETSTQESEMEDKDDNKITLKQADFEKNRNKIFTREEQIVEVSIEEFEELKRFLYRKEDDFISCANEEYDNEETYYILNFVLITKDDFGNINLNPVYSSDIKYFTTSLLSNELNSDELQINENFDEVKIYNQYHLNQFISRVYSKQIDSLEYYEGNNVYNGQKNYFKLEKSLETTPVFKLNNRELFMQGRIIAESGSLTNVDIINNVKIGDENNSILLGNNQIISSNFTNDYKNGFKINSDGSIIANQLILGTGATIADYIQLGLDENKAYIYHPTKENQYEFLKTQDISIRSDGKANFGSINIDGKLSTMYSSGANGWEITPKQSRFRNIVASGKITTSVFESTTTRASGGVNLYRTGEIISNIEGNTIYLKEASGFSTFSLNDRVSIINSNEIVDEGRSIPVYIVVNIDESNNAIILNNSINKEEYSDDILLMKIGYESDVAFDDLDWFIGINATNHLSSFDLKPNSLTFNSTKIYTEIGEEGSQISSVPSRYQVVDFIKSVGGANIILDFGDINYRDLYAEYTCYWDDISGTEPRPQYIGISNIPGSYIGINKQNKFYVYDESSNIEGTAKPGDNPFHNILAHFNNYNDYTEFEGCTLNCDITEASESNILISKTYYPTSPDSKEAIYPSDGTDESYPIVYPYRPSIINKFGIFAPADGENGSDLYLKELKLWCGTTPDVNPTYHFIPVIDLQNNLYGLYDVVSNKFYGAKEESKGNFEAGQGITSILELTPEIVIGDLSSIPDVRKALGLDSSTKIKGMYGQNVFLKGQLTTEVPVTSEEKPTYAGINSNSGVKLSNELKEKISKVNDGYKDESYIIFWGGAQNASELGIQGSKFIVTEEGTLYANRGYFEGSIITEATIEASELKTAKITGTGADPALIIHDAFNGISFMGKINKEDEKESELFTLTQNELYSDVINYFKRDTYIERLIIENNLINQDETVKIKARLSNTLEFYDSTIEDKISSIGEIKPHIEEYNNGIDIGSDVIALSVGAQTTKINNTVRMESKVQFRDKMEYKIAKEKKDGVEVEVGYDLYVYE